MAIYFVDNYKKTPRHCLIHYHVLHDHHFNELFQWSLHVYCCCIWDYADQHHPNSHSLHHQSNFPPTHHQLKACCVSHHNWSTNSIECNQSPVLRIRNLLFRILKVHSTSPYFDNPISVKSRAAFIWAIMVGHFWYPLLHNSQHPLLNCSTMTPFLLLSNKQKKISNQARLLSSDKMPSGCM